MRVNFSLLSETGQAVFYLAWAPGSAASLFDRKSFAWISIVSSQARWWKDSYEKATPLFDEATGPPPADAPPPVTIGEYLASRGGQDYGAFVVLPVPWRARAGGSRRRGAIHISFARAELMNGIWKTGLDDGQPSPKEPKYATYGELLHASVLTNEDLRRQLEQAMALLEGLIRDLNDDQISLVLAPKTNR